MNERAMTRREENMPELYWTVDHRSFHALAEATGYCRKNNIPVGKIKMKFTK